jgi:hypothetical protein
MDFPAKLKFMSPAIQMRDSLIPFPQQDSLKDEKYTAAILETFARDGLVNIRGRMLRNDACTYLSAIKRRVEEIPTTCTS